MNKSKSFQTWHPSRCVSTCACMCACVGGRILSCKRSGTVIYQTWQLSVHAFVCVCVCMCVNGCLHKAHSWLGCVCTYSLSHLEWQLSKLFAKLKAQARRSLLLRTSEKRPTSLSFELCKQLKKMTFQMGWAVHSWLCCVCRYATNYVECVCGGGGFR